MGRIDPGATIDRDCRGKSPIESMATSTLATRSPVLNRWLTRPLFKLTIFFLTAAPMTMGAEWEVEYFGTVAEPLRIHWTYQRLPNDGSRYIGLFNDSVCESLTPMILSDDDPSRGIGRLVIHVVYVTLVRCKSHKSYSKNRNLLCGTVSCIMKGI